MIPCARCKKVRSALVNAAGKVFRLGRHRPVVKPIAKVYERSVGNRLIDAAKEAAEVARGEREPARITHGDAP